MKRVCERHAAAYDVETGCLDCIALEEERAIASALDELREWSRDRLPEQRCDNPTDVDSHNIMTSCGIGFDANGCWVVDDDGK